MLQILIVQISFKAQWLLYAPIPLTSKQHILPQRIFMLPMFQ